MTPDEIIEVMWRQICLDRHGGYPIEGERAGGYWHLWIPQAKKDAASLYAALTAKGLVIRPMEMPPSEGKM